MSDVEELAKALEEDALAASAHFPHLAKRTTMWSAAQFIRQQEKELRRVVDMVEDAESELSRLHRENRRYAQMHTRMAERLAIRQGPDGGVHDRIDRLEELCRRAWEILDVIDPNADITDDLLAALKGDDR